MTSKLWLLLVLSGCTLFESRGSAPGGDDDPGTGTDGGLDPGKALAPSNLPPERCTMPFESPLEIDDDAVHEIDTDGDCDEVHVQPNGVELCVLASESIEIGKGARVIATGSRPLVLLARDHLEVHGAIDASANAAIDGPGARSADDPASGRASTASGLIGGSGGGHATVGGEGGPEERHTSNGSVSVVPGPAGGASAGTVELRPLVGGGRGGPSRFVANSGGGGGALAIMSCGSLVLRPGAVLGANGGGAGAGLDRCRAGGGGGAGGAILIEAVTVQLMTGAALYANGGSGAGGSAVVGFDGCVRGYDGEDGHEDLTPAGLISGFGGVEGMPPTAGREGATLDSTASHGATGGGGSAGRIRINAVSVDTTELIASPLPAIGGIEQR
jgi:hypothetical protein